MNMLLNRLFTRRPVRTANAGRPLAHHHLRLALERLEDRTVPASFTAASVADLIADINAANAAGGSNTITLVAGTTFTLTSVADSTDGGSGLPVIAANDNLSIVGNGDVIQRSTAAGTPDFRLFRVDSGASLALANVTLQGGRVDWGGFMDDPNGRLIGFGRGGAIYSEGSLSLNGVTVQNNIAETTDSSGALGGGIYSTGSLTLNASTIQNNQALSHGIVITGALASGGYGGDAEGGGLFVLGTASLTNVTLNGNTVQGGIGGPKDHESFRLENGHLVHFTNPPGNGGNGLGGGIYVGSGAAVSLHNCTVTSNSAIGGKKGGTGAADGLGEGGGLSIDPLAPVGLDAFTVVNVLSNSASTSGNNISGSYTTLP
jgi:hypothetical protein